MTTSDIDENIKRYVRANLSPTDDEQDYVREKFNEIDNFLAGECFQTGSFARETAVRPIHDLDVIWVTGDEEIWNDTESFMQQLAADVEEQYKEFSDSQPKVNVQTHSITLLFDDLKNQEFSIDVVPATPTKFRNEIDDPIYKVPEVIKRSHSKRQKFYDTHTDPSEVGWTYTDPKGYIAQAISLDNASDGNHRKTAKFLKAWRNGLKAKHGDEMKLKAFHLEQVCAEEFKKNPKMTVYEAVRHCLLLLPDYIRSAPYIEDRAYAAMGDNKHIDNYLDLGNGKVTQAQKELIVSEIALANEKMPKFTWSEDTDEVIDELLGIAPTDTSRTPPTTYVAAPAPWHE